MQTFRATISTAGMTASQFYTIEDVEAEPAVGLIAAGFLVPATKKELEAAGIEVPESMPQADTVVTGTPAVDTAGLEAAAAAAKDAEEATKAAEAAKEPTTEAAPSGRRGSNTSTP